MEIWHSCFRLISTAVQKLVEAVLALVVPNSCVLCNDYDSGLCDSCKKEIFPRVRVERFVLGVPVIGCVEHSEKVMFLIRHWKDHGRTELSKEFSAWLLPGLVSVVSDHHREDQPLKLITAPSTFENYRRRGYRPSELLLRKLKIIPGITVTRTRGVLDQRALGKKARQENLFGAFSISQNLAGAPIVIVDDVLTSGATVQELIRAVRMAGGVPKAAVVLVAVP